MHEDFEIPSFLISKKVSFFGTPLFSVKEIGKAGTILEPVVSLLPEKSILAFTGLKGASGSRSCTR